MNKYADEKEFTLRFIETYECLSALWNTKLESYMNRDEKNKQYEILLQLYKERYPNATKEDVKKKINTLRTNFRREKMRLAECSRSGAGSEDSLEPNLYYYNELQFLNDVDTPCLSKSTIQGKDLFKKAVTKAAKKKPDATEALVEIATKRFQKEKSTSTTITDSWAVKLDRMAPEQRILCEKFVEDILFEGQMGTLTRNSVKINTTASYPTPGTLSRTNSPNLIYSSTSSTPARLESNSSTPLNFNSNIFVEDNETTQSISAFFSSFTDE